MPYLSPVVACGLCLAAVLEAQSAAAGSSEASRSGPAKGWPVDDWASLTPARRAGARAPGASGMALDAWAPVPEEIIVIAPRHVQDQAPLIERVDASNPRTLDAAQPVVRNLQTFCEDKGPASSVCFDMTQVPLRTQILRLFGE